MLRRLSKQRPERPSKSLASCCSSTNGFKVACPGKVCQGNGFGEMEASRSNREDSVGDAKQALCRERRKELRL